MTVTCSNSYLSKQMFVLVKIIPWKSFCGILLYALHLSSQPFTRLEIGGPARLHSNLNVYFLRVCGRNWCLQSNEQNIIIIIYIYSPSCTPHFAFWRTLVQSSKNCMMFCSCSPGVSDSTPSPRPYSSGSPHANDLARLLV